MERLAVDPRLPVSTYPPDVREKAVFLASDMLSEMIRDRLSVVLIPAPDPKFVNHNIRACEGSNPEWYSYLWNKYSYAPTGRYRKNRSLIQRSRVQSALNRIVQGKDHAFQKRYGGYDFAIREIILNRIEELEATIPGFFDTLGISEETTMSEIPF